MPRWSAVSLLAASVLAGADVRAQGAEEPAAPTGTTHTFAWDQERLLRDPRTPGGLAYLTVGVSKGAPQPVVVFLHGMNPYGEVHMSIAPSVARPVDVRAVLDGLVLAGRIPPVVLAAPSHNKGSFAAVRMWPDFDLRAFVDATEAALGGARLDRDRIVVVGHSGAGCNPEGGILGERMVRGAPLAVVAVDTCLKEPLLPSYLALAEAVPVRFYWQSAWKRPLLPDLAAECRGCVVEEIPDLPVKTAHAVILPAALERALPDLLGAASPADEGESPPVER